MFYFWMRTRVLGAELESAPMSQKRNALFVHWIAIIAVLMSSLAPSVSQALALKRADPSGLDFVCSVSSMKLVTTLSTQKLKSRVGGQNQDHQALMDDHCPYCALQGSYVLPLNYSLEFQQPESSSIFPRLFYQSPKPLFAWLTLPSRAPPALS